MLATNYRVTVSVNKFTEYLDVIKHVFSIIFPSIGELSPNKLHLKKLEEGICYRIVVAIATPDHVAD